MSDQELTPETLATLLGRPKPESPVEPQPDAASEQPPEPEQTLDPIVAIFTQYDQVKHARNQALIDLLHPRKAERGGA